MHDVRIGPMSGHPQDASDEACGIPTASARSRSQRPAIAQNWILGALPDALLIIAAPIIVMAAAIALFRTLGAAAATSLIIVSHIVFTVAHHLPTFIRIYGDVELFQRHRWHFILGPVVPLTFGAAVLGYINYRGLPVESFLYLYIMLALWDPWHFMRQHYGFVRIYDRHNAAPRRLAARMDLWLSTAWFVYVMLGSSAWLAQVLADLNTTVGMPLIRFVSGDIGALATRLARDAAAAMTLVYAAYLVWCRWRGYYVSFAKLVLLIATFAAMYLAYVPNDWMQAVAPGWSFKVGFAVIGIVHMTQYLAIVWRYNRMLAARPERARAGWFRSLFQRGGWLIAAGYVLVCLAYGDFITSERANRWVMSALLAIGFTSTLLHYYFDGFIWKVRQRSNRENLALESAATTRSVPVEPRASARTMLLRQSLYFGVPMLALTVGAFSVWRQPAASSLEHMYRAHVLGQEGDTAAAIAEARLAHAAMERELDIAARLARLDPSAARQAELAFLVYNRSYYANVVLPASSGLEAGPAELAAFHGDVQRAIDLMHSAMRQGTPLAHAGRPQFGPEEAARTLDAWRGISARLSSNPPSSLQRSSS